MPPPFLPSLMTREGRRERDLERVPPTKRTPTTRSGICQTCHVVAGFCSFLSALRVFASEGSENRGIMPTSSHVGSMDAHGRGPVRAAISRAVVRLFSDHTGRGPTKARTTIDGELVVVLLHDSMTHAEKTLVQAGKHAEVLQIRRTFQ
jgi:hypothetical protein